MLNGRYTTEKLIETKRYLLNRKRSDDKLSMLISSHDTRIFNFISTILIGSSEPTALNSHNFQEYKSRVDCFSKC